MTKPYSVDLRVRVVDAVDEGATRHEAAERFGVSVSSAVRWHQAWRHEGTIEAKPYGGSRSPLEDYAEEILAVVEEQPDLTLDEIIAVMRRRKIPGSRTALFRFLERRAVTWLAPAGDGYASRACWIPPTLSSSMRHRSTPT
jgi:transposase